MLKWEMLAKAAQYLHIWSLHYNLFLIIATAYDKAGEAVVATVTFHIMLN